MEGEIKHVKKQSKFTKLEYELKEINSDRWTIEGYCSLTEVEDLDGDVIAKGAFSKVNQLAKETGRYPRFLYQHDHKKVIGFISDTAEDSIGEHFRGELINTTLGRDVREEVKTKSTDGISFGFTYALKDVEKKKDIKRNYIKSIHSFQEISIVTFPSMPQANILNVKSEDGKINVRELEKSLRDAGLSRSEAKALIHGGFSTLTQRDADTDEIHNQLNRLNEFNTRLLNSFSIN